MTGAVTQTRNYGRKSNTPCKCGNIKCLEDVDKEAICCDACDNWYHNKCSRLDNRAVALYVANKCLKWVCFQCIAQVKKKRATGEKNEMAVSKIDKATDCLDLKPEKNKKEQNGGRTPNSEAWKNPIKQVIAIQAPNPNKGRNAGTISKRNTKGEVLAGTHKSNKGKQEDRTNIRSLREMVLSQGEAIRALEREKTNLSQSVHHLRTASDIALGRNRNVVIKGVPEPFMKEKKQRDRAARYHVNNLLRMVGLLVGSKLKRVFRLGKWKPESAPRPVCVEFANPRTRDRFLSMAGEIARRTERRFLVEPDDSAGWRINSIGNPLQEAGTKVEVRAIKLPGKVYPTQRIEATREEPRQPDHTQGSLDGWVMVKPRRTPTKNGVCPRT